MRSILRVLFPMLAIVSTTGSGFAATISGTVTNKTTDRPAAGDKVVLVDVSAGMADSATAVTDAAGHYSIQNPGSGPYLIRVDHQGGSYFIAAPQGGVQADITVYDVAPKVEGVGIDADMLLIEASRGTLRVRERYLVRNVSSPPHTQFSENTFEIALPDGAILDEAAATRPGGLGTRTHLIPLAQKTHFTFNVPIQPDQGEKETLFEVQYHFAYSGRHDLTVHPQMPADNLVVYTAKGIEFAGGTRFHETTEDPRVETHVAKNVHPGDDIGFTVSGEGEMPADSAGTAMQATSAAASGARPPGGAGVPVASSDPLFGSTTGLLGGFAVLLAGAAFLLLRRRKLASSGTNDVVEVAIPGSTNVKDPSVLQSRASATSQPPRENPVLDSIKEELFALEQDKISGRISVEEYANVKVGLEAVLKRALSSGSR